MKTIMVLGICRTGKTTFSRMIQKEFCNYQIIEIDAIIAALQKTIPDIPIGFIHDNLEVNKLPEFLNLFLQQNIKKNGKELGFIINGDSILPSDLIKYFNLDNMIIYYLVNRNLSPIEILKNCRTFDDENAWTKKWTDKRLINHFQFYKDIEETIIRECEKYQFHCLDTSFNREQVLKNALDKLKSYIDND